MSPHSKNKIGENGVNQFREKIQKSSSGARVLHMTTNLIISRHCQDENSKEMYQNVKRTCRACRAVAFAN